MPVLLMRHAETDWALVNGLQLRGAANDLAPLTPAGRVQAELAAVASQPVSEALVVIRTTDPVVNR